MIIYANEEEGNAYYYSQAQLFLTKKDTESPMLFAFTPKTGLWVYWSNYSLSYDYPRYQRYLADDAEEKFTAGAPDYLKNAVKTSFQLQRDKLLQEIQLERSTLYGGMYKALGGKPYLWKILDREKPLTREQRILMPSLGTWPTDMELQGIQWHVPELDRLKLVAFALLLQYHAKEEGVFAELCRRYHACNPQSLYAWMVKEQMRAFLREWAPDQTAQELAAIPTKPLNATDEFIQWQAQNEQQQQETEKE